MKAKKALVLVVLTVALLAVALILPAAAFGKAANPNQPVSWVNIGDNSNGADLPDSHGGLTAKVEKFADDSVRGEVLIKVLREFWPDEAPGVRFHYLVKTRDFTSDWWDSWLEAYYGLPDDNAEFYVASDDNWPAELGERPQGWPYGGAAVADFVVYVPISEYKQIPPWLGLYLRNEPPPPSIPYRFMFIDRGGPGATDLTQSWLVVDLGFWHGWYATQFDPAVTPGDPVPTGAGNVQVHVGP